MVVVVALVVVVDVLACISISQCQSLAQDVRPTKPERDLVSECRAQLNKVLKVADAKAEAVQIISAKLCL